MNKPNQDKDNNKSNPKFQAYQRVDSENISVKVSKSIDVIKPEKQKVNQIQNEIKPRVYESFNRP